MAEIPNVLFKYCNNANQFHLDALQRNYWYFAHRDDFNDPGDFHVRWNVQDPNILRNFLDDPYIRRFNNIWQRLTGEVLSDYLNLALDEGIITHRWVTEFFRRLPLPQDPNLHFPNPFAVIEGFLSMEGIQCLSKINNSTIMWSHYSNGHRGFCVAYDCKWIEEYFNHIDEVNLFYGRVSYEEEQPDFFLFEEIWPNPTDRTNDALRDQTMTKALPWAYEEEYRILNLPRIINERIVGRRETSRVMLPLPPRAIKNVIFGHRATDDFMRMVRQISPQGVRFQQARVYFDRFEHVEILDIDEFG